MFMNRVNSQKTTLPSQFRQWISLIVLLCVATLIAFVLEPYFNLTGLTMLYVGVVAYAAYTLSRNKSLLCALLSVLCLNFFFVPPRYTLHVDTSEHLLALLALCAVALLINRLVAQLKSETLLAQLNAQRAQQLQALAMELSEAETEDAIFNYALSTYEQAFQAGVILYRASNDTLMLSSQLEANQSLSKEHRDGLLACIKENKIIGAGTGRWNDLAHCYLPLGTTDVSAAIGLLDIDVSDDASREHGMALASLVSHALMRLKLSHSMLQAQEEIARQQMQTMFLSAISHDLRTPLSVVIGAASALQSQAEKLSQAEQQQLTASIISEARYLGEITENTLQLLKLEHNQNGLRRDWESIEEIIGSVLARLKQREIQDSKIKDRIKHKISANLPLLYVDAVLIAQLISNLVDNALKYSGDKVILEADVLGRNDEPVLQICVKDRGPGIPKEEREHIFEIYTHAKRHDQSTQRGAGLGLALCRVIAQAHQAELFVTERQHGGSNFVLRIPIPQQNAFASPESLMTTDIDNQSQQVAS